MGEKQCKVLFFLVLKDADCVAGGDLSSADDTGKNTFKRHYTSPREFLDSTAGMAFFADLRNFEQHVSYLYPGTNMKMMKPDPFSRDVFSIRAPGQGSRLFILCITFQGKEADLPRAPPMGIPFHPMIFNETSLLDGFLRFANTATPVHRDDFHISFLIKWGA